MIRMVCTFILLACTCVMAEETKVPVGCTAAAGSKTHVSGWAQRIIHQKSGIELVFIPAGTFKMGTNGRGAGSNTVPLHQVTVAKPFYMGKTEITNAQYRKFIKATKYDGKPDTDPAYDLYLRHFRKKSLMSAEDNYPVVWVSWHNAKSFCKWADLSLPSEAQWEYACRAGTTTPYYFGTEQKDFDDHGWGLTNSDGLTHPVAEKKPNSWGLHDMYGNAWEWCEDDYVYKYHGAPTDGSARIENLMTKTIRGNSWSNSTRPVFGGSHGRHNSAPGNAANNFGFRVVLAY
jgi:formylglycine-generating enzyme required for sulfatase activity